MLQSPPADAASADGSGQREAGGALQAFLIPSVFGDEPQLHDLRLSLRGAFRFDLLALPDVGAPGNLLTDMAATGRSLVCEIARRQPAGPVALVGYSFGASMALEVAVQLAEAGRRVAFLAVLDGPFDPPTVRPPPVHSVLAKPRNMLRSAIVDATESMGAVRRLVAMTAAQDPVTGGRAEPMRRAMLWHLRNKALRSWIPRGCDAPGLLVSTGDYGPGNRERWKALCPELEVVDVGAAHEQLLMDEALPAVSEALSAARRKLGSPDA